MQEMANCEHNSETEENARKENERTFIITVHETNGTIIFDSDKILDAFGGPANKDDWSALKQRVKKILIIIFIFTNKWRHAMKRKKKAKKQKEKPTFKMCFIDAPVAFVYCKKKNYQKQEKTIIRGGTRWGIICFVGIFKVPAPCRISNLNIILLRLTNI